MGTVLILTVGTTVEPLLKALEEHHRQDADLRVYLLYGRPFPGQHPSPLEITYQLRQRAAELGVRADCVEVPDPENLDTCLQRARQVFRGLPQGQRVVVDFTGGAKPLSAAVVHAALAEPVDALRNELVFEYTGGQVRDQAGRVLQQAMHTRVTEQTSTEEVVRQVLDHLRRFAYREARALAERLPQTGRSGFLRSAVDVLCAWDEFDYESGLQLLRRQREVARMLRDDAGLGRLAGLLLKLADAGEELVRTVRTLLPLHDGPRADAWPEREPLTLLVADALENAARRTAEGRFTDAVLRAYRAVETAVQARLLASGVNPWHPDWDRLDSEVLTRYQDSLQRSLPGELALTTGLKLVEVLHGSLPEELKERLQDVQVRRNRSYLEHGYQRLTEADAHRLLEHAAELCAHLAPGNLAQARQRVSHHVWF